MNTLKRRMVVGLLAASIIAPTSIGFAASSMAATSKVEKTLQSMIVDEKLAHDVYVTLGEQYDLRILDNISGAETTHMQAIQILMERYGVSDPTSGDAVGEFDDPEVQALFDRLVARGEGSLDGTLAVGKKIEKLDIADLNDALDLNLPSDVDRVLTQLKLGSQRHLAAFSRLA